MGASATDGAEESTLALGDDGSLPLHATFASGPLPPPSTQRGDPLSRGGRQPADRGVHFLVLIPQCFLFSLSYPARYPVLYPLCAHYLTSAAAGILQTRRRSSCSLLSLCQLFTQCRR